MGITVGTASEAVRRLRDEVRGDIVAADEPDYDEARRVWNGMIDRRPLAVVRAAAAADVAPVLDVARRFRLPLAVRGGGHNVAGNGTVDDGIVLDLGRLATVDVDPAARTVTVAPGVTLGDLDRATEPFGLAVPTGVVSATGVAGLTLGGGVGWLTRPYGLSVDSLVAVDLVTASGDRVGASETENAELFWALRGGGGNFGVVTSFTFRAYPLGPSVFAGNLVYRRPRWAEALRAYVAWTGDLPDELTSIVTFLVPPAGWELGDEVLMLVGFAWAGTDHAHGERLVAGLRRAAHPDAAVIEPTTWTEWQSAADGLFPRGVRAYWKNASFHRFDEAMIDAVVEHAGAQTSPGTAADIHHMAGAYGRVADDATAFPNRSARYWLNIYGFWAEAGDDGRGVAWVRGFHTAMEPHAMDGHYVNFLGHEGGASDPRAQALAAYGPAKLERLVAVKRRYDPDNLFRLNHNIPPD